MVRAQPPPPPLVEEEEAPAEKAAAVSDEHSPRGKYGLSSVKVALITSDCGRARVSLTPSSQDGSDKMAGPSPLNVAVRETIVERQVHFSVERLAMDLPFVNVLCVQKSTQRSAGPLGGAKAMLCRWTRQG